MQPKISLCMIVKDEGAVLKKFLSYIKGDVDEIIIVDTGSKDKTKEIARRFTKKVYGFEWCDDFSKARNFSISKATKDWILAMDPDEKISKEDLKKIKEILERKEDAIGFRLIQKTFHKGKAIGVRGICRIFRNFKGIKFVYPIHETVRESIKKIEGRIGKTGVVIEHYPKVSKEKQEYYLKLLKIKKEKFPESNVDKEIENECSIRP